MQSGNYDICCSNLTITTEIDITHVFAAFAKVTLETKQSFYKLFFKKYVNSVNAFPIVIKSKTKILLVICMY